MPPRYDDDAELVRAAQSGDEAAFTTLYRRWFDPCFDVARRIVHDDGRAAEITQDTFLAAWKQLGTLRDAASFGGWVLRTARNRALNRLEHERRSVPTDDTSATMTTRTAGVDVAADVASAEQRDLVWVAAAALGERDASVLDLHLRHGLDVAELAGELHVTPNNASQMLFRMKARLGTAIRAWVLYGNGSPSCVPLRDSLASAGVASFGAPAVKVIDQHATGCEDCADRRSAVLAPESMFAAVPVLVVAPGVRAGIAEALRGAGVPLGPDAAVPVPGAGEHGPGGTDQGGDGASGAGSGAVEGRHATATSVDDPPPAVETPAERRRTARVVAAALLLLALFGVAAVVLMSRGGEEPALIAGSPAGAPAVRASATAPPTPGSIAAPTTPPPTEARSGTSDPTPGLTVETAVPTTNAPLVVPPVTAPPTWTPPPPPSDPSTTPPTPPVSVTPIPPPPVIDTFTATAAVAPGAPCPAGAWATTFSWTTSGADAVTIESSDTAPVVGLPADGSTVICRPTPGAPVGGWRLRVAGPGGTTTRTL